MDEIERLRRAASRGDGAAAWRLLERGLLGREHAEALVNGLPPIGSGVRRGGGWTRGKNRSSVSIPSPPGTGGGERARIEASRTLVSGAWKGVREWDLTNTRCRNVYSGHLLVWAQTPADVGMLASSVKRSAGMRQRTILAPGWTLDGVAKAIEASYRWATEAMRLRGRIEALVAGGDDEGLDALAGPPGHRRNLFMAGVTLIKIDLGLLEVDRL